MPGNLYTDHNNYMYIAESSQLYWTNMQPIANFIIQIY